MLWAAIHDDAIARRYDRPTVSRRIGKILLCIPRSPTGPLLKLPRRPFANRLRLKVSYKMRTVLHINKLTYVNK